MSTDWKSATDPVQRRELTEAEKRSRAALLRRRGREWLSPSLDASPSYVLEPDFDEAEA